MRLRPHLGEDDARTSVRQIGLRQLRTPDDAELFAVRGVAGSRARTGMPGQRLAPNGAGAEKLPSRMGLHTSKAEERYDGAPFLSPTIWVQYSSGHYHVGPTGERSAVSPGTPRMRASSASRSFQRRRRPVVTVVNAISYVLVEIVPHRQPSRLTELKRRRKAGRVAVGKVAADQCPPAAGH